MCTRMPLRMAIGFALFMQLAVHAGAEEICGPLRVCSENPRYFENGQGGVVLLTGSHVWYNLVDMGPGDPPPAFDFSAYLAWMNRYGHNFMRLWRWELTTWRWKDVDVQAAPHPWRRTGPGLALDGKPKFDLDAWDEAYFERLRTRAEMAARAGVYVSVMLFEGWGLRFCERGWERHPFHPKNNVNHTEAMLGAPVDAISIFTMEHPGITALQERYVYRVLDTLKNLNNVLYEISNENHPGSTEWQYHMIGIIREREKGGPKQHPVGMTYQTGGGRNQTLFDSPADWISPNRENGYRDTPPPNEGAKVILNDTDHLWGIGGNQAWVWKSFFQGLNPIFMDPYDGRVLDRSFNPRWEGIRISMGQAREWATKVDLKSMFPSPSAASTGYCLANPGQEYLAYLPDGTEIALDLDGAPGRFSVEWFCSNTGEYRPAKRCKGGASRMLQSPFEPGGLVVHLKRLGKAGGETQ